MSVDRTRVFPPEPDAQYIPKLQVDEIHCGGFVIKATQGTRYANGRLSAMGKKDNSIELGLWPGEDCKGKGVIAQILIFSGAFLSLCQRWCMSIVTDGVGN